MRTGGLYFNIGDYVRVINSPSLNPTNAITIAAWVYPLSIPSPLPRIVTKERETMVDSYALHIHGTTKVFRLHIAGTLLVEGGLVALYSWQHVAATWDSVSKLPRLYVNGDLIATGSAYTGPIPSTTYDVLIGNNPTNSRQFHGIIDDVRIYNRALSGDEIKAIYERDELIKDGLVLYLDFTEYEGNIAYDKSGNNNNGTIYGGARWVIKKALRVLPSAR
ncbi:MAG: LamG domain-containing protein [Nitrososphaerota archaeon]